MAASRRSGHDEHSALRDRFIPQDGAEASWIARARAAYAFDMASAVRRALKDLRLEHGRVAFDDMGFGFRLEVEGLEVAERGANYKAPKANAPSSRWRAHSS
jgi:hypothetical protein